MEVDANISWLDGVRPRKIRASRAYVTVLYGEDCSTGRPTTSRPARHKGVPWAALKLIVLSHRMLVRHKAGGEFVVFIGRGCNRTAIRRALGELPMIRSIPDTSLQMHRFPQSNAPTASWMHAWMPKLNMFKAFERDFYEGTRIIFHDADAVAVSNIDELFEVPLPQTGCLLAADPSPTWQGNSGVMPCVIQPMLFSSLLQTFYAVGTRLGDSDQDILAYHFSGSRSSSVSAVALDARYNAFVVQLAFGRGDLRGREAVLAYQANYIKIVHYCCGAWRALEDRCDELQRAPADAPLRAVYTEHCSLHTDVEQQVGNATGQRARASCYSQKRNRTFTYQCIWPNSESDADIAAAAVAARQASRAVRFIRAPRSPQGSG